MADYLQEAGDEIMSFLTAEYDYDMDMQVNREEAREKGREEGIDLVNKLHSYLIRDNRMEELKQSCTDSKLQKELMKEYQIVE